MEQHEKAKITVFTPVYNRADTLPRLYESLKRQTDQSFVWIIVNDGSTDESEKLVKTWVKEHKLDIKYFYQENAGKPTAHNQGVKETETELFVCVDSDDYLKDDAIEKILMNWEKYKKKNTIGIIGYKERTSGECVTSFSNLKIDKATLRQFYDSGLQGDTILVYRTDILKRYSFPQFKGEKFIPEAYLYDLLDQEGKLILIREALYVCEYLEDGYSANMAQLLYNNPQGYFCYINQRLKFDTTIKQKCADTIRYLAMAIAHSEKNIIKNSIYPVLTVGLYGAGYIFYFKRYRKFAIRNGK